MMVIVLILMWRRIVGSWWRRRRVVRMLTIAIRIIVLGGDVTPWARTTAGGRGMRWLLLRSGNLLARGGAAGGHLDRTGQEQGPELMHASATSC